MLISIRPSVGIRKWCWQLVQTRMVVVEIGLVQRGVTALALGPNPFGDGLFRLLREPLRT